MKTKKCLPPAFQRKLLCSLIAMTMGAAHAGVVRDDVDYQQFRDFAENKGKFFIGATNMEIKGINGENLGVFLPKDVPMPDLSAAQRVRASNTLVLPQYILSVAHNDSFSSNQMTFGPHVAYQHPDLPIHWYGVADSNQYTNYDENDASTYKDDYKHSRLTKLVTEVIPASVGGAYPTLQDYLNKYSIFIRVGSGVQAAVPKNFIPTAPSCHNDKNCPVKAYSYQYPTGGEIVLSDFNGDSLLSPRYQINDSKGELTKYLYSKNFLNIAQSGDSGSPIFGFNKETQKWEIIALHARGGIDSSEMVFTRPEFNKEKFNEDNIILNNNQQNKILNWKDNQNGKSLIDTTEVDLTSTSIENSFTSEGLRGLREDLNSGKTVHFTGEKGTLNLQSDINQGAGALYFETDFTVKSDNPDTAWLGAGVSVADGKTVDWKVKNPQNDRLSKIGKGTLHVSGSGDNLGDISVGDGTVILNQTNGQAFSQVGIVSGRPIVRLENDKQVNPNNIYFGFRGGRLDVNGNNLTFNYIKNLDEGAMIVNHNASHAATITLKANPQDANRAAFNGVFGETDAARPNGKLNLVYAPSNPSTSQAFLLSGGSNLNGNLTVDSGSLLLSGRPTPHAYDHIKEFEPFKDDDWLNRTFNASNMIVNNNSRLTIGRNVQAVNANVFAQNNATVKIGFENGQTPVCVRSDYFGSTNCTTPNYATNIVNQIPTTNMTGNVHLADKATLTLGKVDWVGKATSGNETQLTLTHNATWRMSDNSSVGDLSLQEGSVITLNPNFTSNNPNQFNTLTVEGNLSGKGQFNYLAYAAANQSDKVVVKGIASGNYILNVKDHGQQPDNPKDLVLMKLDNTGQTDDNLTVKLQNDHDKSKSHVDFGAWRYTLVKENQSFLLKGKEPEDKETDGQQTDGQQTDGQQTDGQQTDGQQTDGQQTDGQQTDGQQTDGQQTDGQQTGGQQTGGQQTGGQQTGGQQTDGQQTGGQQTGGQQTGGQQTGGEQTGGEQTGGEQTGGEQTGGEQTGGEQTGKVKPTPTRPLSELTSKYTNSALSAQSAQIDGALKAVQHLNQNLWDTPETGRGLWLITEYAKQQKHSPVYRNYRHNHTLWQLGSDKSIPTSKGKVLLGAAIANYDGQQTFAEGSGKNRLLLGSIYGKWFGNNHTFLTFDSGYGVAKQDINLDDSQATHSQNVAHLGMSAGKTWNWGNFAVQPAIGVRYHYLSGKQYQLNGAEIVVPKLNLMAYHTGVKFSHAFSTPIGATIKPYYSTTYTHVAHDAKITVNQHHFALPLNRYWQHQAGVEMQKGRWGAQIYATHEQGKQQNKRRAAGMMFNYRW